MISMEYPKIETLYNRDEKTRKVNGVVRLPEFENVKCWHVTEKVDGTNVRVALHADGSVEFGGRTESAQMPVSLICYLQATFTPAIMQAAFDRSEDGRWPEVILFGEGYGEKIQNGGNYRSGVSFRLFDVRVGDWWLEPDSIHDVASKLDIFSVPEICQISYLPKSADDLKLILPESLVAYIDKNACGVRPEGIVARSTPLMLTRRGDRIMWKLKYRDF